MIRQDLVFHAGRTTLFCAIAELSVNDLYYGLAQSKQTTRHAVKRHYSLCLDEAKKLKRIVKEIPEQVGVKAESMEGKEYSDDVIDSIYEDVEFYYDIIRLIEDRCGNNKEARIKARAMIFNMKSELGIYK